MSTSRWDRAAVTDDARPGHAKRLFWVRRGVSGFAVVMLIYLVLPFVSAMTYDPGDRQEPILIAAAALFGVCHLSIVRITPTGWQRALEKAALGVQAVLTFVIPLVGGALWLGLGSYLLGSLGIVFRARIAVPVAVAALAAQTVLMVHLHTQLSDTLLLLLQNVITGVCITGGVRLAKVALDLFAARDELAGMAVDNERLRFSRELHDVLGHNLSAIALKSELTSKLIEIRPELAQAELDLIREIAAKSLTDVRAVAKGYRSMDLRREADSLTSILRGAGVGCETLSIPEGLPPRVTDVLAWALREGVTNVLRHAKATTVELKCTRDGTDVELEVLNNGVAADQPKTDAVGGNGLVGLGERVRTVGGQVVTGSPRKGWFALVVRIPDLRENIDNNGVLGRTEQPYRGAPVLTSSSRAQDTRGSRR
jgi:two-component system sensor histidine kinase DesK